MKSLEEIYTSTRTLMGPGPSDANPKVLEAMSRPLIGHLDPVFLDVMDSIKEMTRLTFQTENELTFAVSAPGSAGMETCFVNLIDPGDDVLICVNGVFGNRMVDVASRCGAVVTRVDADWGSHIEPAQVQSALETCSPKILAIVHAETSTGVLQPLEEIGAMAKNCNALFLVDAVTSYCGTSLKVDDWGIDAIYSGTQKCLSAPPGLSPVSFSERAVAAMENKKTKVQSWFLDTTMIRDYWAGTKRAYHHTAPVSSMFALHKALEIVLDEGLENRFERHRRNHLLLKEGIEKLGFEFLVADGYRLPMLNSVIIPTGVDDQIVRSRLLKEFNIEIGGGLGDFAGKIWRIGLMGESSTPRHVEKLLDALKKII